MQFHRLGRREFITLLGGAAAFPLAARAQPPDRVRRIGFLMNLTADDPQGQARLNAFRQRLAELSWTEARDVQIDIRWGSGDVDQYRRHALELVELPSSVIVVSGSTMVGPLQQMTRTLPIVFVQVSDPVGAGFVQSLARPGGNTTGFSAFEYGTSGKWLELLKEIAPRVRRAAVLRDSTIAAGSGQLGAIQSVAPSLGVELSPISVRDAGEIGLAIAAFARGSDDGMIVTNSALALFNRDLIITLAARHRLPAVYPNRFYAVTGGLISYGPDPLDPFRSAAGYVDRILKGERPADLPVQAPSKYELIINLKTAKTLGLEVPPTLLVRADEVIE